MCKVIPRCMHFNTKIQLNSHIKVYSSLRINLESLTIYLKPVPDIGQGLAKLFSLATASSEDPR